MPHRSCSHSSMLYNKTFISSKKRVLNDLLTQELFFSYLESTNGSHKSKAVDSNIKRCTYLPLSEHIEDRYSEKIDYSESDSNSSKFNFDDSRSLVSSFDCQSFRNSESCSSSDESYYSTLFRSTKRRKFNNSELTSKSEKNIDTLSSSKNISQPQNFLERDKFRKCLCLIPLWLSLIIAVVYLSNHLLPCSTNIKENFNLNSIESNLSECLIGQDFSRIAMMKSFSSFNFNSSTIPLLWMVGPVGVGKSYTRNLVKSAALSPQVKVFSILKYFLSPNLDHIKEEIEILIQNLDTCHFNLIWIDGFNENGNVLFYLTYLLEQLNKGRTISSEFSRKIIIVVIGTYMSKYVTQSYINHISSDNSRETFDFNRLQQILTEVSPFENKRSLISLTILPFLPLEISHVKKCVIQELNFLQTKTRKCSQRLTFSLIKFLEVKNLTLDQIIAEVFKIVQHDLNGIVSSGCKRIFQIVKSLVLSPIKI